MEHSAMTLDSFARSFCSTSRDDVLESAGGGWGYFDSRDSSDLMDHSEQICQYSCDDGVTAVVGLLQDQQSHLEEHFFSSYDHSTSSHNPQAAAMAAAAHLSSVGTDEDAVVRAMMAVISSSNSSSSAASSPSAISNPPPPQEAVTPPAIYQAPAGHSTSPPPSRAFRPYSSNLEPRETRTTCGGQKMIKESVEMVRRMRSRKGEESRSRSTNSNNNNNNQLHHMISEGRRREKLNDSFHELRMMLPPDSKDKASVLINARNHLRTLRAQIAELEEKNRRMETHLLREEGQEEGSAVRVQVTKAAADACGVALQQIDIMITAMVQCDMVDLLLRAAECLRGLRVVSSGCFHRLPPNACVCKSKSQVAN